MKIFKSKYAFQTTAHSNNPDGSVNKCYLDVNFARGTEPEGELEGDLILRVNGKERKCFFSCYRTHNGDLKPKLVVMGDTQKSGYSTASTGSQNRPDTQSWSLDLSPEDFPFDE